MTRKHSTELDAELGMHKKQKEIYKGIKRNEKLKQNEDEKVVIINWSSNWQTKLLQTIGVF